MPHRPSARPRVFLLALALPAWGALCGCGVSPGRAPAEGQATRMPYSKPEALKVPGERLKLRLRGVGTQIYLCRPVAEGTAALATASLGGASMMGGPTASFGPAALGQGGSARYAWTLLAPEADLHDTSTIADVAGPFAGSHFLGPTWQYRDGSKVVGVVRARAESPDPGAIPWLLLTARSVGGPGIFDDVTSIQRLRTTSGRAPTGGCDAAHAGAEARVGYTAEYFFYHSQVQDLCE